MTLLKNILHAHSNRLFQLWMRENVKIFVTDCLENDVGYLVRHSGLHSLMHELHQCLAFRTHFLFSWIILESGWAIASRIHNLRVHKAWTEDRSLDFGSSKCQFVVQRLRKRD